MSEAASRDPEREAREISMGERLSRAFSLRRNLRMLFVPPEGHLRPLDGLRALSILWVVVFHAAWYAGPLIPVPTYAAMVFSEWMLPIWRGDFGVDVFFVLSGFLIAGMLVDERESTGTLRLGLFYVRRLLRLWPALGVACLLDVLLIGDNASMIWANLLYVSNFIPIFRAAMGWTWSLAIEEQFYVVCPWLVWGLTPLRGRTRLAILGGITLLLCGIAAWVVVRGRFHAVDAEIAVNRDLRLWARGYDHLYVKPWMRAGALLMGVAAAYIYRARAAMEALSRGRVWPVIGLLVALAVAATSTHWPLVVDAPRPVEVAYLALFRTTFGAAVAYVLLLAVSRHPLGSALGRVLSSRLLYPFGQLAYSAYLLNPIVALVVHRQLAPLVWMGQASPMTAFLPADVVATFLAAVVLHLFVERPIMELRPKAKPASRAVPA
jgi:peptidoglycan/LPS O-acetylase OafA/YrhL